VQQRGIVLEAAAKRALIEIDGVLEVAALDALVGQFALGLHRSHQLHLPLLFAIGAAGIDSVDHVICEPACRGAAAHVGKNCEHQIGEAAEQRQEHDRQNPDVGAATADHVRRKGELD